jgi:hypothetical protein
MNREQRLQRVRFEEWAKLIYSHLDPLQKLDHVKTVYTSLDLGIKMCARIPVDAWSGDILVVSDLGLLCAVSHTLTKLGLDTVSLRFLSHLDAHKAFAEQQLGIEAACVPYASLEQLFAKDGKMNYFQGVKFDVIVGNPPFQSDVEKGKRIGSGAPLWHRFVEKAFSLTKDDGHILFVTPNNWRRGSSKGSPIKTARDLMWKKATIFWYLDAKSFFPMIGKSATTDAWHLQKGKHHTELPQEVFDAFQVLPTNACALSVFEKFFSVCESEEVFEYVREADCRNFEYSTVKTDKCPYRHARTSAKVRKGEWFWYDRKTETFDRKKVIVSKSGNFGPWYECGECGVGDGAYGYLVKDEDDGKKLVNFLNSIVVDFVANEVIERRVTHSTQFNFSVASLNPSSLSPGKKSLALTMMSSRSLRADHLSLSSKPPNEIQRES